MISLVVYKNLFMAELLVAEYLFTFRLKKRKFFLLRAAISCVACLSAAFFFPILSYNAFYSSTMFLALTAISVAGLMISYDEPFLNVIYCAVAAYTVRHLAFQFFSLYVTIITGSGSAASGVYGSAGALPDVNVNFWLTVLGYVFCYFIVYTVYYTFFGRRIGADGQFEMQNPSLFIWVLVILFVDIVLNAIVVYNSNDDNFLNGRVLYVNVVSTYIYNILCCFFMLFIQSSMIDVKKLEKEISVINHIWRQEREQYEISKENIDLINRKCHDLKYQIRKIAGGGLSEQQKKEIEDVISIYDGMLKTGNEALDVIFAEKSLVCRKNDIKLNWMIDGKKIDFMETADIYVLFGNLIDNAIEAVEKLVDGEKRIISLNVYAENEAVKVEMSNYYAGEIILGDGGLPKTSKSDKGYHGIGLRSVRLITESYGGKTSVSAEDGIFTVKISIPIRKVAK